MLIPELVIDPEFHRLIPPQSEDERAGLEASLLAEGCRDALIVWAGHNILVDGHHRYIICQQHNIPFTMLEHEFDTREDVIIWMVDNQLARRNLNTYVKSELIDRKAQIIETRAKQHQATSTGGKNPQLLATLPEAEPILTRKEIAEEIDTGERTYQKARKVIRQAPEIIKEQARAGDISVNRAYELTRTLQAIPDDYRDNCAVLCGDNLEKAQILTRLHKSSGSPETNGTFFEIMNTGGFAYGDEMQDWCNFREAGVEAIRKGLDSLTAYHKALNYKRDAKTNRASNAYVPQGYDACQTPGYALDPLLPYLDRSRVVWEPAQGDGLLVEALYDSGFNTVEASDLLTGKNFFEYAPKRWDVLITNPPYSIKYEWLARCYALGKPFALLVPVETLGAQQAQSLMREHGFEIMLLDNRVDFQMPNKGFDGAGAQFPVMWLCWKVLPDKVMFGSIKEGKREFKHAI